jgi:S1-C subfamily serine protease
VFDVKKLAATTRPAVALVTVLDKSGKPLKLGTGFFVSSDGKLVTNAHVIEGADNATAKLENGATYSIRGVLKAALDKDLVLLQADAKDVPSLTVSRKASLPEVGSRIAVIGSPLGLESRYSDHDIWCRFVTSSGRHLATCAFVWRIFSNSHTYLLLS